MGPMYLANSLATTCWECMFPISLSGVTMFNLGKILPNRPLVLDTPVSAAVVGVCVLVRSAFLGYL